MHTLFKPAGIPVFPPHADPDGDCVLSRWLPQHPEQAAVHWPDGFAGGIAHRLDIGTSGALAVAASLDELEQLRSAFRDKALTKSYRFVSRRACLLYTSPSPRDS